MDKKKQRVISIIIGVILASLLLYIGVRVVQQRVSKASLPENLTASRVDADTCKISATTKTDEPVLLKYGETAATFYFRMEAQNIQPQADGSFLQEADINNLGAGKIMFLVENSEDVQTTCEPFTGDESASADGSGSTADTAGGANGANADGTDADATGADATGGNTADDVNPDTASDPLDSSQNDTASDSTDSSADPEIIGSEEDGASLTPTPAGSLEKTALTGTLADAYFKNNPSEDFTGCMTEFKDDYYSIVQVCNEAWRAK